MRQWDETRNYIIKEINQNELLNKKHKKVYRVLNYVEHFLILISTVTGCISISAFASLVGIPIGITSSAKWLNNYAIITGIKKYKSIIKKKKKQYAKIVLLAKSKLKSIEIWISKALISSNISHDEFVLITNVLEEFYDTKEQIKNSNDK